MNITNKNWYIYDIYSFITNRNNKNNRRISVSAMSISAYTDEKEKTDKLLAEVTGLGCKANHDNLGAFMKKPADQEKRNYTIMYLYLLVFLQSHSPCVLDDVLGDTWVSFARQHELNYSDAFLRQVYLIECEIPVPLSWRDRRSDPSNWVNVFSVGIVLSGIVAMRFM